MLGGLDSKALTANLNEIKAVLDLSGAWRYQPDGDIIGVTGRWFIHKLSLPDSLDTAGKGNRNGTELALARRLTRDKDYTGPA
jgi:hypothetical protein